MSSFEKLLLPLIRSVTPVNPDDIDAATMVVYDCPRKCPRCKCLYADSETCHHDNCPMGAEL